MLSFNTIKLSRENYDKKTKLEQFIDYYDCPVCMMMKEEFMECPSCTSRACLECLIPFSREEHKKNPQAKAQGIFKCILCQKVMAQKTMHKYLARLLLQLKFKCQDCLKTMTYENLKGHKGRGECQRGVGGQEEEEDAIMDFQPNAQQNVDLVRSLYILERDSKYIHEYVLQTKTLIKH